MPASGVSKVVIFLLVILVTFAQNAHAGANRVICQYSSAATSRSGEYSFGIEDIPVQICTHVLYDGMNIDMMSSELIPGNPAYDVETGWEKFTELKTTNPDLKLLLGIRSPLLLTITKSTEHRQTLIENIKMYMEWMRVDGVELFWSASFGPEDGMYPLVEELKRSFEAAGHPTWEVIVLVEIDRATIDHARLCRLVDYVHVVGAMERVPLFRGAGKRPLANALFNIGERKGFDLERAVRYWIENNCPAEKIVLGVIFAAQTYTLTTGSDGAFSTAEGHECPQTRARGYCGYFELCQKFNETDWTLGWDDTNGMAPNAERGDQWVAYENEVSVERKGYIARSNKLAGVYGVALDVDDYRGKCGAPFPLSKALWRSFKHTTVNAEPTRLRL